MKNSEGQIIIIAAVFMLILVILITGLVSYAGTQTKAHRQGLARVQGLNIAEAGIESAIWKLNNQPGYNGETGTAYNGGVYNIVITPLGGSKIIRAEAFVPNAANPKAKRVVQVTVGTGTFGASFNYGMQVGNGGIDMDNNARIVGNVYSHGEIDGSSQAHIQGSAVIASATDELDEVEVDGNATAYRIEDATVDGSTDSHQLVNSSVGGNAVATTMSNCTIGGNATYDTKSNCTIGGTQTTPNPNNFVVPPAIPFPITDQQIEDWEQEAEAGGVITSQTYTSGTITLGPKKINGNLIVKTTATLVLTGPLWVTGDVDIINSAVVRLDANYAGLSGVLLAGVTGSTSIGEIEVENSAQVLGSGSPGSYLMLVSQKVGNEDAIDLENTSSISIGYAPYGRIEIANDISAKTISAWKVDIENNATITYETGLASVLFSSGAAGSWEMLDGTWVLLQ